MIDMVVTGRRPRRLRKVGRGWPVALLLRRHRGLIALVVAAAGVRVVALVAIYPGIWFSDGNGYIRAAATGRLSGNRVDGYSLLVAPFWHAGSAGALIVTQHVIGLGVVVVLYALLMRRGVPRSLAVLAVVPAAVDAYLIVIEHAIMAETVFHAALVGALVALLWKPRPGPAAAAAGGVLLGYAGLARSVAVPLVGIFLAYLLVRRVGWRPVAAFCVGWTLITAGYATIFRIQHGKFAFTESTGHFLYGKVAPFADCAKLDDLPAGERSLCPDPRHRLSTNGYMWGARSPLRSAARRQDARIRDFALRVIRAQPLTYARTVLRGVLHYFEPGHPIRHNDYPVTPWQFPSDPRHWGYPGYRGPIRPGNPLLRRLHRTTEPNRYVAGMVGRPRLNVAASRLLHGYQRSTYTSGPVLAACVLVVLLALARRAGVWRLRLDAALLATVVLAALLGSQALSVFSYRYGLLAAILLPAAAALAVSALLQSTATRGVSR